MQHPLKDVLVREGRRVAGGANELDHGLVGAEAPCGAAECARSLSFVRG